VLWPYPGVVLIHQHHLNEVVHRGDRRVSHVIPGHAPKVAAIRRGRCVETPNLRSGWRTWGAGNTKPRRTARASSR
jgi:hypothetical protein